MLRLSAKFVVLVKEVRQKVLCFRPRYLGGSCVSNFAFVEQKMAAEQKKPLNARPLMELCEILRKETYRPAVTKVSWLDCLKPADIITVCAHAIGIQLG